MLDVVQRGGSGKLDMHKKNHTCRHQFHRRASIAENRNWLCFYANDMPHQERRHLCKWLACSIFVRKTDVLHVCDKT